jgi:hypothetical protein
MGLVVDIDHNVSNTRLWGCLQDISADRDGCLSDLPLILQTIANMALDVLKANPLGTQQTVIQTSDLLPERPSLDYPSCVLNVLHSPKVLLGLNPNILEVTELPHLPERPDTRRYALRKKLSYLPYGMWDSSVSFLASFFLLGEGLRITVDTGMGVKTENVYRIKSEDQGKTWRLEETATVDCSAILAPFVVSSLKSDHKGLRRALIERLEDMR